MKFTKTVKNLDFGNSKLIDGVNKLADAVGVTLGPSGRTVVCSDDFGNPHVTKDGVTVAKHITLENEVENLGVNMIRQAASQTATKAGDGTTTSTILAQAIIKEYFAQDSEKKSFRDVKAQIEKDAEYVLKNLNKKSVKVDNKRIENVSIISANNDKELGTLISDAFKSAGDNGVVTFQNSPTSDTFVTNVEGTRINGRPKTPHFHTNKDKEQSELEKPLIFISATEIENIRKIQDILEHAIKSNRSILLIAPLKEQPLMALAMNAVKGNIKVNVIDPPSFGLKRKDLLEDLALLVGGKVFDDTLGDALDAITPDMLGSADKAISDNDGTVLVIDEKDENTDQRIQELTEALEKEDNPVLIRHYEARLALLHGGVSVIHVGADTEVELKEKLDRVEDAVAAVKAAKREGILPGGGSALYFLSEELEDGIMKEALKYPYKRILSNASLDDVFELGKWGIGVDARTGKVVDMKRAGIIDPALVAKQAVQNAVSVATTILSTDCVISNIRE